ncbi:MAG: CoB--CoM heterodisulfide reductase subunit B [Candidatus Odinarchaeota archaeon]|nr:CoB--CoM heterodisulfide reductase subunit B [Candidatus Odinarchaeota archaeon]
MAKYAFFLGCIAPLRYPGLEAATKKVMQHFGIELLDLNGASCCPAPGVFGSFDLWNWLVIAARNLSLGESLGADLTTICNGCYATLQEAWHILKEDPGKRRSVNEILSKINRTYNAKTGIKHVIEVFTNDIGIDKIKSSVKNPLEGLKVAIHYGCHFLKPRKIRGHGSSEKPHILEDIVKALGAEPIYYKEKLLCCGAGGGVRAGNLDTALEITARKLKSVKEAGADCILHPCSFCHFQFDRGQVELRERKGLEFNIPVIHLVQLIGLAVGIDPKSLGLYENEIPPTYLDKLGLG